MAAGPDKGSWCTLYEYVSQSFSLPTFSPSFWLLRRCTNQTPHQKRWLHRRRTQPGISRIVELGRLESQGVVFQLCRFVSCDWTWLLVLFAGDCWRDVARGMERYRRFFLKWGENLQAAPRSSVCYFRAFIKQVRPFYIRVGLFRCHVLYPPRTSTSHLSKKKKRIF